MSFFNIIHPKKKRGRPTHQQTSIMTRQMQHVIQSYVKRYSPHGYYTVTNQNIIKNITTIITPFMVTILNKYNEGDFHEVMKKRYYDEDGYVCWGFDYIGNLKANHPTAYTIAMMFARSYKKKLNFDVNVAAELMIDIMYSWGWHVWPHEKEAIHHMLYRIKRIVQSA